MIRSSSSANRYRSATHFYNSRNFSSQTYFIWHRSFRDHNISMGHAVAWWWKHYATSRKVTSSRTNEVNDVRFEALTAVTMKVGVFWDIKSQFVLHRRHIMSPTQSSQLMLCKIWGFHCGDYEECRLLGYKIPVRTSQETHYVSVTELSQLMPCKIRGFHGGDYEGWHLLGCYAVWLLYGPTFRRNLARPSSGWQESVN
jgi:hypothetical protein